MGKMKEELDVVEKAISTASRKTPQQVGFLTWSVFFYWLLWEYVPVLHWHAYLVVSDVPNQHFRCLQLRKSGSDRNRLSTPLPLLKKEAVFDKQGDSFRTPANVPRRTPEQVYLECSLTSYNTPQLSWERQVHWCMSRAVAIAPCCSLPCHPWCKTRWWVSVHQSFEH